MTAGTIIGIKKNFRTPGNIVDSVFPGISIFNVANIRSQQISLLSARQPGNLSIQSDSISGQYESEHA